MHIYVLSMLTDKLLAGAAAGAILVEESPPRPSALKRKSTWAHDNEKCLIYGFGQQGTSGLYQT